MSGVLAVLQAAGMVVTLAGLAWLAVWEWSGGWHDAGPGSADRGAQCPRWGRGTRCDGHRANNDNMKEGK